MAVNPDSGSDYGADTPVQRFAIRKVVRGENGLPQVIYIDSQTGEQLNSLEGYQVITAGNTETFDATKPSASGEDPTDEKNTTAGRIKREVTNPESDSDGSNTSSGGRGIQGLGNFLDRSAANNYGYIDTPKALSLAGFIPGPIGTVAKTADRAVGVNNTLAANEARKSMGLGNLGIAQVIGNILGLRDESSIADVNVNNRDYSVGFEALTPLGQTTLTPNEARRRNLAGTPLTELTLAQRKERNKSWKESEFAKKDTGLLGGLRNAISGLFGGLSGQYDVNDFPDAPSPVTTNSNSFYDNFGGYSPEDSPIGSFYGNDGNDGNGGYNTPSGLGGSGAGGGFSVGDIADSLGSGGSSDFGNGFTDSSTVGGLW